MSLILSLRAGRTAGKAAKIYLNVMGKRPSPDQAEYLKDMGYYTSNEFSLAFYLLSSELMKECITPDGDIKTTYLDPDAALTKKIIQTLEWMVHSNKVPTEQSKKNKILFRDTKYKRL